MIKKQSRPVQKDDLGLRTVPGEFVKEPKASQKQAHSKKAKTDAGKLSLYPLSVEDALRAAARTGRMTPVKPKRPDRGRKRGSAPT